MSDREADDREARALERIERARRRKPRLREERITMAHGAGGRATDTLVRALFVEELSNPLLDALEDQAVFDVEPGRLAFTTDSFVVRPLFFPGGSIGELAVNGTINDLAAAGARPLYLSAAFILEEGFPIESLRAIARAMGRAAKAAGVAVVTGDTKVVEKGKCDGCFLTVSGVGVVETDVKLGAGRVRAGDAVLVTGPIGDHGITILLARGDLALESAITSDTAPLHELVRDLLAATSGVHAMRDPTRGGVATVLNEIAIASGHGIVLDGRSIPVRPEVRGACELLGLDPLYVACEGRMVIFVDAPSADAALGALRAHPLGRDAARIGTVEPEPSATVVLRTELGGTRVVDMLAGDPLPRICQDGLRVRVRVPVPAALPWARARARHHPGDRGDRRRARAWREGGSRRGRRRQALVGAAGRAPVLLRPLRGGHGARRRDPRDRRGARPSPVPPVFGRGGARAPVRPLCVWVHRPRVALG